MIIVIFLILVALTIWLEVITDDMDDGLSLVPLFFAIMTLIAGIWLGASVTKLSVIDEQIEMYQEENTRIEEQIADVVQQYQEYESGIFADVASESSITLLSLYPELKADALVQSQIDIYVANNEKIKSLKEQQIDGNVKRWWLYFGSLKND